MTRPKATPAEVEAAIAAIRHLHAYGVKSRSKHPHRVPYGSWKQEAEKLGLQPDTYNKCRGFADPDRGYSISELNELCRLCRKHGTALARNTVIKLITVPKPERFELQREAIVGHWTEKKLFEEIKKRFGKRRTVGGRNPPAPTDAEHACVQIADMCDRWQRWYRVICEPESEKKPMVEQLKPGLRRRLEEAQGVLGALKKEAAKRLPKAGKEI